MKITVCIPLYNGEHCVESALKSLELQTRKPDEVIIRDDCSSDNWKEIISRFTGLNINLFTNEVNLGLTNNWNKCLEDSNGDIVTFLHQDDGFEPKFLEQVEKDFETNSNSVGMWTCGSSLEGIPFKTSVEDSGIQEGQKSIEEIFTWEGIPAPPGVSFRRSALLEVGFYDPEFKCTAYVDLYFRLISKGYLIYKSEKNLVWRTLPETRATTMYGDSNLLYNEWLYFLEKYSIDNKLVSNNLIVRALSNFYYRASFSVAINIFRSRRYGEALGIIKTIHSRGKDFEKLQGLKSMSRLRFLFLIFKRSLKLLYFFLRRRAALIYRALNRNKKAYN